MTDRPSALKRAAAETIGTCALVLVGCGAIITGAQRRGALGVVGVGLCFFLTRRLPARDVAVSIAAQQTRATLAALIPLAVWPHYPAGLGATVPSIAAGRALLLEAMLSALLTGHHERRY